MSLTSAIDSLVALVDGYSAVPLRRQPPFDAKQFMILDRDVYVEAVGLGLTDHLPPATYVNNTETFGHTNFPGSKGTMHDPPAPWPASRPIRPFRAKPHALRLASYAELEGYVHAFAAGHLHLLMLFGPPGVGKSRVVRQARSRRSPDPKTNLLPGDALPARSVRRPRHGHGLPRRLRRH
jgi:hypothetical protein